MINRFLKFYEKYSKGVLVFSMATMLIGNLSSVFLISPESSEIIFAFSTVFVYSSFILYFLSSSQRSNELYAEAFPSENKEESKDLKTALKSLNSKSSSTKLNSDEETVEYVVNEEFSKVFKHSKG